MISIQTLVCIAAMAGPGQTVLLDFYSDSCGPCRSMEPTVRRLVADGFEVRKVNVEREQQLTRRFAVDRIPTFVMIAQGREVDRVVGPASYDRLRQMITAVSAANEPQVAQATSSIGPGPTSVASPTAPGGSSIASAASQHPQQRARQATVRLRVEDPTGNSFGTGTIIHARDNEALVITCGHLFRDSSGQGRIEVDLFAPGARGPAPGKLLAYDLKNDVALVTIWPSIKVDPVPVASESYQVRRGEQVFSIGCDRGADASIRPSHVTALNKYKGPANIEVAGQPVIGRSGGGLFTADGQLIGVCNLADPQDDEGIYAALSLIHDHLAVNLPRGILQQDAPQLAAASVQDTNDNRIVPVPPSIPRQMPRTPRNRGESLPVVPVSVSGSTSTPDTLANLLQNPGNDTEVIVLVRSKSDPNGPGQIITIENPSPELLSFLTDLQPGAGGRTPTVLQTGQTSTAIASRPDRSVGSVEREIVRGQAAR